MKRLMYYPSTSDELIEIYNNGIQPDNEDGVIYLYKDRESAEYGFGNLYGRIPDFVLSVLVEETDLIEVTIIARGGIQSEYRLNKMLSSDSIALSANNIYTL